MTPGQSGDGTTTCHLHFSQRCRDVALPGPRAQGEAESEGCAARGAQASPLPAPPHHTRPQSKAPAGRGACPPGAPWGQGGGGQAAGTRRTRRQVHGPCAGLALGRGPRGPHASPQTRWTRLAVAWLWGWAGYTWQDPKTENKGSPAGRQGSLGCPLSPVHRVPALHTPQSGPGQATEGRAGSGLPPESPQPALGAGTRLFPQRPFQLRGGPSVSTSVCPLCQRAGQ